MKRAPSEFYRRRQEAEDDNAGVTHFSETQEIRAQLLRDGHPDLVVKAITASIQRLEGRILEIETELAKKVDDSGAWRTVNVRLLTRRDAIIAKLVWAVGIPGAVALVGLLLRYAWKGAHTP